MLSPLSLSLFPSRPRKTENVEQTWQPSFDPTHGQVNFLPTIYLFLSPCSSRNGFSYFSRPNRRCNYYFHRCSVFFFVSQTLPTSYFPFLQVSSKEREISRSRELSSPPPFLQGFEGSSDSSINLVGVYIILHLVTAGSDLSYRSLETFFQAFKVWVTGLMRGRERGWRSFPIHRQRPVRHVEFVITPASNFRFPWNRLGFFFFFFFIFPPSSF